MPEFTQWSAALAMIARTATARGREQCGYFSLEGTRLHERALRAGLPLASVVAAESYGRADERERRLLHALQAAAVPPLTAPDAVVAEATSSRGLGAILGLIPLPSPAPWSDLMTGLAPTPPLLLLALDVVDPGNVGALVRTAHGIGASGLVAVGRTDLFHPRAVRTAMGSLFKVPWRHEAVLSAVTAHLRPRGIPLIATLARGGAAPDEMPWSPAGAAILVGGEYHGLAASDIAQTDHRVTVPMAPGIDSFSVNAAAAIVLYEARRQLRRRPGSSPGR